MYVVEHDGTLKPLDPDRIYRVAVNSYLAGGGDSFSVLNGTVESIDTGVALNTAVERCLAQQKTVTPKLDGRIRILP